MEAFDNIEGEPRYFEWLAAHPAGFVVNTLRPAARPNYLVLHAASCWTIHRGRGKPGAFTGRNYQKVCSESRAELEEWVRTVVGGELSPCGTCWRPNGNAKRSIAVQTRRQQLPLATVDASSSAAAAPLPGQPPLRWLTGQVLASVEGIRPLLASWDAASHPAQVRLKAYLDDIALRLKLDALPRSGLSIDLVVDVELDARLI